MRKILFVMPALYGGGLFNFTLVNLLKKFSEPFKSYGLRKI